MSEMSQMASAVLAIVFAAVMLIAGQLFIKSRAETALIIPADHAYSSRMPSAPSIQQSHSDPAPRSRSSVGPTTR
jgi:hypothetical protein